ncbi:putative 26S proteasome regulatory subunit [Coemansia sp. RSA 1722]|nr:putative 26S proteasome regulatory subunit [Coemansia sp. RSA 486]KAJ2231342.1 putative 26S proteasome regulatory subunit [Coemansia sp. RSA 485]KAJ2602797.1 putative 26S proteasome regulatory subunit [Coemansia sp. RSA 1721]KAJ2606741.1 putative 26S proteasome regulatory subunit [Coemansia sp. RSA 1722]KAJ2639865.1 putative 26S proteasome regulatory subunit [Coemansia sp. RSA 1286]
METTQKLVKRKSELESEIRALELDLKSHGVNRTEPLLDQDGFPRSDIDIVAIVEIRRSLNYKQNDLKALMAEIEQSLVHLHQQQLSSKEPEPKKASGRPFARISMVAPNSPASDAGFLVGDTIVKYGSVEFENHDGLKLLIKETTENIDKKITVVVERVVDGEPRHLQLELVPNRGWGGDGLLGCYILPISK